MELGVQKQSCDALYYAAYLVTQNDQRDVLEGAALAVRGNRIVALGPRDIVDDTWQAERVYDLGKAVLLPGLMNGHTHIAMSFLRGKADDKPLMDWLTQDIFPVEAGLTQEWVRLAAAFSCAELVRTGTTAIFDMYPFASGVFEAVDASGMRGVLGEGVMIFPTASFKTPEESLSLVRQQADAWRGHSRIRGAVLPHAVYTTTPAFLEECRDLAEELNWVLGMHLAETAFETQECIKTHGKRPVELCHDLGLLHARSTFFHNVEVNDADLDLIAASGAVLVHNPASNMKLASGVSPLDKIVGRGIPLGLGTDGPASNNAQNMFRDMYLSALLQKVHRQEATAYPAQLALDSATRGGAAALHWEDLGSLEVGHIADFIALDLTLPNMQPVYNVVSNLVYAASGHETMLSVVDGKVLYYQGVFTQVDYQGLLEEMERLRQWTLSRA